MTVQKYQQFKNGLTGKDFERIKEYIEKNCGIKLPPTKKQMVEGRLRKRLKKLGFNTYEEYLEYSFRTDEGAEELINLIDVLTTNKTDFYREPGHFEFLQAKVLPYITAESGETVKVWSAGCSSGEEPYTLAMELHRFFKQFPQGRYEILATDISTEILKRARLAVYQEEKISDLAYSLKKEYFLKSKCEDECQVRLKPFIRKSVRFGRLNLMDDDYGIKDKFDIIFCRNVIIYFDRETQERILSKLVSHLKPGRFLFLGHSETIHGMTLPLETLAPTVYRKI